MAAPAIALRGVSKSYGSLRALSDVSFEVGRGEAVGYLGPNGAGKSTTLKLLVGATRPSAGTVTVFGAAPAADRATALAPVGALVETPGVAPYVHARDLLDHAASVRGSAPDRAAVESLAERVRIRAHLDRPVGALSTGLMRRVLLGVALIGEPAVLLLDEPTLGLDPAARRDLRDLLRSERRSGRTILVSTHLLDDVEAVCDRVLFLRDGRLVGDERLSGGRPLRAGSGERRLEVQLLEGAVAARVVAAAGPEVRAEQLGGGAWTFEFIGDDRAQAALVARLVSAGLGVLRARTPDSELARRYLEVVGREDESR